MAIINWQSHTKNAGGPLACSSISPDHTASSLLAISTDVLTSKMVCPMRIFVGLGSLIIVIVALAFMFLGHEEPDFLRPRSNRDRSWLRYISTFFTGELIYEWYKGGRAPEEEVAFETAPTRSNEEESDAAAATESAPEESKPPSLRERH